MKTYGIAVKLWAGIIVMTILLLLLIMVFQTEFLYDFYFDQEVKQLEKDCKRMANYLARGQYNFAIPYSSIVRRVNDITIATDVDRKIFYVQGTSDYKEGFSFGFRHIDDILRGETIKEKNRMIRNPDAIWDQTPRETLMVGVPIRKNLSASPDNNNQIRELDDFGSARREAIIGAVYIITPLEQLETTVNAIRLQFLYIFVGAIILASILSFLLSQSFSEPLKTINNAAMEISKGNYNTKIDLVSSKEIKELGDTMNNLAKQLSRVEQIRREFIANVSHEIRTPLSYLQGYTEVLMDGFAESEEERQKYLAIIMEETVRLKLMVDEILQLSQLEDGHVQLKNIPFSIDSVIKRTIDKLLPIATKRHISIKYQNLSDEIMTCLADENRIKQVLINLLNNAIKHSYDYGNILISTYRQNEFVYVCVRDFGEGIPEEDLPFIWDRFYTVDKQRTVESTGLGLAIVKNILNAHGTGITASSVLGEGTEFCFYLQSYIE